MPKIKIQASPIVINEIEYQNFFVINSFNYTYKNHVIKMNVNFDERDGLSITSHFSFYVASFKQILLDNHIAQEKDKNKIKKRLSQNFNTHYSYGSVNGNLNPGIWSASGINPIGQTLVISKDFQSGLDAIKIKIDELTEKIQPLIPYFYWHIYLCSLMHENKPLHITQESFYIIDLDYKNQDNPEGIKTFEQYIQHAIDKGWFKNIDNEKLRVQATKDFYQLFWQEIINNENNLEVYYPD